MSDDAPIVKPTKLRYDCSKCPAYCCSYERINVDRRDIGRLARHFGLTYEQAEKRFTKIREGERVLRHQKDRIYGTICMNLDLETRRCTVYEARPGVCRQYPEINKCGYYEFLSWERRHQDNDDFIPLEMG
jgi:Fe-S-cluster containining protein